MFLPGFSFMLRYGQGAGITIQGARWRPFSLWVN